MSNLCPERSRIKIKHTLQNIAGLICLFGASPTRRRYVSVNFSDDGRLTYSVSVLFSCFALVYTCFEILNFLLSNNITQMQFDTAKSLSRLH